MRNVLLQLKNLYKLSRLLIIPVLTAFFFSCTTVPQRVELETNMQLLPLGSDIIIKADIKKNTELVYPVTSAFMGSSENKDIDRFLKSTDTIWTGLDIDNESNGNEVKASLVSKGDYPAGLISLGLNTSKEWTKKIYKYDNLPNKEIKYWQDVDKGNQIAIPQKETILVSNGKLEEMLQAWAEKPEAMVSKDWLYYESTSDVTIMARNLSPEYYGSFIPEFKKFPIKTLILSLIREKDTYNISGTVKMESGVAAFLFSTLFKTMILIAKDSEGEKLFKDRKSIKVEVDENSVNLTGMILPLDYIIAIESKWLSGENKEKSLLN